MLLYAPAEFQDIPGLYKPGIPLTLWWISIGLCAVIAILLILKSRTLKDTPSVHLLTISYAYFFFAFGMNRLFFIISYITPYYNEGLGIGYAFASSSLIPVLYTIEKYIVKKTKFVFSIISIGIMLLCLLVIVFPEQLLTIRYTAQSLALLPGGVWFLLYLYMVKLSTGAPRMNAILSVLSVGIAVFGYFLDSEFIYGLRLDFTVYLAPILYIIGLVALAFVQLKKD
jgi:hypothetical protein